MPGWRCLCLVVLQSVCVLCVVYPGLYYYRVFVFSVSRFVVLQSVCVLCVVYPGEWRGECQAGGACL